MDALAWTWRRGGLQASSYKVHGGGAPGAAITKAQPARERKATPSQQGSAIPAGQMPSSPTLCMSQASMLSSALFSRTPSCRGPFFICSCLRLSLGLGFG